MYDSNSVVPLESVGLTVTEIEASGPTVTARVEVAESVAAHNGIESQDKTKSADFIFVVFMVMTFLAL